MEKIKSLFALKAICAFFVIIIHFPFIGKVYLDPITKISVPIFYMITGYFLFAQINESSKYKLYKAIKKTFYLILTSNLVYLIYNILTNNTKSTFQWNEFFRFIFIGDNISGHLYFLTSYIWGIILLALFPISTLKKYLPWLSLLILGNLLFGRYIFIKKDFLPENININNIPLGLKNNAIFLAIPCFSMGYIARKLQQKMSFKITSYLFIIFIILIYSEFFFLRYFLNTNSISAFLAVTFPLSIITLLLFIKLNSKQFLLFNLGSLIGNKYSSDIYLWHPIIGNLIFPFITFLKPFMAIVIYTLCILLSHIINLVKNKYNASISK